MTFLAGRTLFFASPRRSHGTRSKKPLVLETGHRQTTVGRDENPWPAGFKF